MLYASIFIHQGIKAARRDDFISVAYILLYIVLDGNLPWANKSDAYYQKKGIVSSMSYLRDSPFDSLIHFIEECYSLGYEETIVDKQSIN